MYPPASASKKRVESGLVRSLKDIGYTATSPPKTLVVSALRLESSTAVGRPVVMKNVLTEEALKLVFPPKICIPAPTPDERESLPNGVPVTEDAPIFR